MRSLPLKNKYFLHFRILLKAHIGSRILTSIVQDNQNNIQPTSDSNSESDSDSDRVERIVGSTSNSSELSDSGDQATNSQQQQAEETIPESSTSRYGRKRTRALQENYVPWHNIHVETNLVPIIKHQIKSK